MNDITDIVVYVIDWLRNANISMFGHTISLWEWFIYMLVLSIIASVLMKFLYEGDS